MKLSNKLTVIAIVIFGIFFGQELNARNVTVIKTNGRKHWFSSKITYRTIIQKFDENNMLFYQECRGKGNEDCPKIALVTLGFFTGSNQQKISGIEIVKFAEKQFAEKESGKAFYKGVFLSWKKAEIIKFDGTVDYEYELFISDEIKNNTDFIK